MKTEQQLVHDISSGDRKAMQRLYNLYSGCTYAVCLRYITDRQSAQDVLQDCFVKILTSMDKFQYRGEGSLKAWIQKIAANESLTHLRKNGRISFTADIPDLPDIEEDPDVGIIPADLLMAMVRELPDGYRTIINLYVFEQMSHKEIAELLNIKEVTSASQYLRAKRLLAKKIKSYIKETST